jgi:hypothetical protein
MATKQWGPFTGRQLTTMFVVLIAAIAVPVGATAAVSGSSVFVTDAKSGVHAGVDATGSVKVRLSNPNGAPGNQFSLPPAQLSLSPAGSVLVNPDPSGTRYLISSFTVTNPTAQTITVFLNSYGVQFASNGCAAITNQVSMAKGPSVTVGPNTTGSLTFPQPFVIKFVTGPKVCLAAGGAGFAGNTWSAVGYKLLPVT